MGTERAGNVVPSNAPNIGAEYEITIFDKDGNEKRRFGGEANCFVKGFMDYLYHLARNGRIESEGRRSSPFVDTNGSSANWLFFNSTFPIGGYVGGARAISDANIVDAGIVVGRSTTPVALGDYNVGSIVGTSELQYDVSTVFPIEYSGNVGVVKMSRMIVNAGSSVVSGISSVAVYVKGCRTGGTFMILRDVVPAFDLAPFESAIVSYRIVINGSS